MNIRLDNRVIEGKMPLTWFDADKAKEFIGKTGYFSDNLICFKNIDNLKVDVLTGVDDDLNEEEIYQTNTTRWIYFLPDEWVKSEEPEKKYREYKDLDEFFDVTGLEIGDLIKLKFPGNNVAELLIVGSCDNGLFIGIHKYTFKQLFEIVEISISGEWQPFGVIDDDVSEIIRDVEKAVDKAGEL